MKSTARRILMAVLASIALGAALHAQSADAVVVSQRVRLEGSMSRPQAERAALEAAMADAVRRVVGVRVSGTEQMINADSAGRIESRYLASVRLDAAGHVLEWTLLKGRWSTVKVRGGVDVIYEASYRMLVARDTGRTDPGFRVTLAADRGRYLVRSANAPDNDEVVLTVSATRDAHLVVVAISGDTARRLVPNAVTGAARLVAGTVTQWPSAEWRERGVHFRVGLPAGESGRGEVLAAIALLDADSWPRADGGPVGLGEFNRWLVAIPADRRAVAQQAVKVERP